MDKTLEDLIIRVINQGASDLHVGEGRQPIIRVNGDLIPISEYPVLNREQAKGFLYQLIPENYQKEFEQKLDELREAVPTVGSVDSLQGEEEKAVFVKTFRDLLRIKSSLETFADFSFSDLGINEQEFYDYQSKYLDTTLGVCLVLHKLCVAGQGYFDEPGLKTALNHLINPWIAAKKYAACAN
jgi:hypothetical protein